MPPLITHLHTSLLKACLQRFLYIMFLVSNTKDILVKKNVTRYTKGQKTKTKQKKTPQLKMTMINMLKGLMDKVDSMQERRDNANREMEILRKKQKKS